MVILKYILFFAFIVAPFLAKAEAKGHVFLVPGTGNSLLGKYFSPEIIQKFESRGYSVKIPLNLSPIGGYRMNAKILSEFFSHQCHEKNNWAVGHSAGGLYILGALNKSTCKIEGVITVGSPLNGAVLAKSISETYFSSVFRWFVDIYPDDAQVFEDFLPEKTLQYLSEIQPLTQRLKLFAIAGTQPRPTTFVEKWDAEFLMPHLDFLSRYLKEENDGMVTVSSAQGRDLVFTTVAGKTVQVVAIPEVYKIDHLEQFQSVKLVNFLHKNIQVVTDQQNLLYEKVLSLIEAP